MKKNIPHYLKVIVIVHGKSEKQICGFIKSSLRLTMQIVSDKNGGKSIQITSLMKILEGKHFKSIAALKNNFCTIEECTPKKLPDDFKIFIIMDTDDCTELQRDKFINGEMFKKHWAHLHIVPIFNSPELETVLEKSKIKFEKKGNERKGEYIKIFPTDLKPYKGECIQLREFSDNLALCKQTNMHEFILHCLQLATPRKTT